VGANVVAFKNRAEALAALESGSIDAFAGDKVLLLGLGMQLKDPAQFEVLADDLGFEPYAIALPRNDSAFRLAVNRGLAQVFRSEAIAEIFRRAFGPNASPTLGLRAMFDLGSFPE
jgi:ABC-type amino acid transport substrate-binding protein